MCAFPIAAYGRSLAALVVPVCVGRTRRFLVWPPAAPRCPNAGVALMIHPYFVSTIFALIGTLLVRQRIEERL